MTFQQKSLVLWAAIFSVAVCNSNAQLMPESGSLPRSEDQQQTITGATACLRSNAALYDDQKISVRALAKLIAPPMSSSVHGPKRSFGFLRYIFGEAFAS